MKTLFIMLIYALTSTLYFGQDATLQQTPHPQFMMTKGEGLSPFIMVKIEGKTKKNFIKKRLNGLIKITINQVKLSKHKLKMIIFVYSLDISDEQKNKIIQIFKDFPLKSVNSQAINYSSLSRANDVLNYLSDSLNKIIKNVTSTNSKTSSSNSTNLDSNKFSNYYDKVLKVNRIAVFENNYNLERNENVKTDSYIILLENEIQFKKANGTLSYRNLKDKKYN